MHWCLVCGKQGHTAPYCPKTSAVADYAAIQRRLRALGPTITRVEDEGPRVSLEEVVAGQLSELVDHLDDFQGFEEMPVTRDLTTYADAFASARKRCRHQDVNNVEHRRTWYCTDCRQYLDYDAMRRVRGDNYWWSW